MSLPAFSFPPFTHCSPPPFACPRSIKRQRAARLDKPADLKDFDLHIPRDYLPGAYYDVTKDFFTPPWNHPYHQLPPRYKAVFDRLGIITYMACVRVLEHTEWPASPDDNPAHSVAEDGTVTVAPSTRVPITRRPKAICALEDAIEFFAAYPPHPPKPLKRTSRPVVRALEGVREVLSQAPVAPRYDTDAWGTSVPEKLEFVDEPSPGRYVWNAEFLEGVFAKLCELIERDPSAWEDIRWEVYDKVRPAVPLCVALRLLC